MRLKRIIVLIIAVFMCSGFSLNALADDDVEGDILNKITAKSVAVYEMSTCTLICQKNSEEIIPASHFAKLMTLLIAEEQFEAGKLKISDKVIVSANANSKLDPQIWLDVGESITVDELIKSITIGNANDACTALAEKIGGTEQDFVQAMNEKAKLLGMKHTRFTDSTGENSDTVSTAYDLALLSAEIMKHESFIKYYTTWMENVRNDTVELVSTNRLIRSYKGITGLKSCSSEEIGSSLIATVKRGNMSLCAVVVGCSDDDTKFDEAKELLNYAFEKYEIYEPEIEKDVLKDIEVKGGEQLNAKSRISKLKNIVIPKGTYPQITSEFKRKEEVVAPAEKGNKIGQIVYKNGNGDNILELDIVLADDVKQNSLWFSFKRILVNLFK